MSGRHHSSYQRRVQDTPIGLLKVWLQVRVRRFRCPNQPCRQQTFAEQYLDLVQRRRQRTQRLITNLTQIGLALSGQAGTKLADKLGMTASGSTLLRLLHHLETPAVEQPRVIGIDDWAFRKGRSYGTLIVDHERGKAIDVLPDREGETVKQWLAQHPTVEIVTRDRSGEYREAISQALPHAVQIADRWHLLKILGDAVQRHLSRHYRTVCQLVAHSADGASEPVKVKVRANHRRYAPGPAREALHAARTEQRAALFAAVKARYEQGVYTPAIAKEFNLSRQTVSRWVNSTSLPPDTRGRFKQKCLIDAFIPYLRQRIEAGCTNQSLLWREISQQGFTGTGSLVGKWIRQHYQVKAQTMDPLPRKKSKGEVPSPRELAWILIRHQDELAENEQQLLKLLLQDIKLAELRQLALQFMRIVRNGLSQQWSSWLESSCASTVTELKHFAMGLKKDEAAVYEAIKQPWNNGPTEGHVNKLKFLKQQMYGRASFDLLRLRVLLVD
jgi:transposase